MSDLNQMIRDVKKGEVKLYEVLPYMQLLIERFEASSLAPICCYYYNYKLSELKTEFSLGHRYIQLDEYENFPEEDERVIGCSRGCMPVSLYNSKIYSEKLCNACIREAKRMCKISESISTT